MQDHPPLLVVADLDTVVVATGQEAAPPTMLITLLTNLPPVAGQSLLLAKATIAAILVIRIPL